MSYQALKCSVAWRTWLRLNVRVSRVSLISPRLLHQNGGVCVTPTRGTVEGAEKCRVNDLVPDGVCTGTYWAVYAGSFSETVNGVLRDDGTETLWGGFA